jgi:signal transduction histidine kinase
MTVPIATWVDRQEEYWKAEGREKAASQLVGTCWFVLVCQFVFIGLDHWIFPERFPLFLAMRLAVNLAVIGVLLRWRHEYPNACQLAVPIAVAIEILVMIYTSGDSDSLYFAGLILVLVGIPVLQPISVRGSILVSSICVSGFILCAVLAPASVDEQAFTIEIIFILAAGFESAVSCRALGINRVITYEQRREIESTRDQLASLDEAKTRFSANVHHELRTPLTLILAPLETLRGGDLGELSDPVKRALRTMHANGQRLLKLINDLLALAKLESDRFSIRRCQVDLYSLVEDIVDGAGPMADRKNVSLSLNPRVGRPFAFLDHDAVEKIAINLVSNALKFTGPGGTVIVDVEPSAAATELTLRVRDTGAGLAEQDLGRIFDRFAQVDGSATREQEGTGIGLSLVKELVELHDGHVWAESDGIGQGSTICVQFPVGEPDDLPSENFAQSEGELSLALGEPLDDIGAKERIGDSELEPTGIAIAMEHSIDRWESSRDFSAGIDISDASSDKPNIVVADDNADMRELLDFVLGREFAVHLAQNGREALKQVERVNPDLVVTDIMMPEMTGIELCRTLKESPKTAATPVMLVSSKAESEMKIKGLELGADDYVTKPFHPKELLARARGLVRLRVLQREIEERNEALEVAIHELKAAELQLVRSERLAAVGEIAAGVAHEVNNPVNFALNAVRALRVGISEICEYAESLGAADCAGIPIGSDQSENLHRRPDKIRIEETASNVNELGGIIADGLERTHRLVTDLLDFASPVRIEHVEVDLAKCIRSTAALFRPAITTAGATLEIDMPDHLPPISGDPGALNQVILNLTRNALEAMANHPGQIQIETELHGDRIDVRVIDDGPGLEPAAQERLFEPFFTTKNAGSGTGLGLSISRQIAENHGGDLTVESKLGMGTTFTLSLPMSQGPTTNTTLSEVGAPRE